MKKKFSFREFWKQYKNKPKKPKAEPKKKKVKEKKVKPPRVPTEFEKYYFNRLADRKEYKQRRLKFAMEAVPKLIDGCGGIKNISKVKLINYVVEIQFKNMYQVKEDVLKQVGGLYMKLVDHKLTNIFDAMEAKKIVSMIKKELKASKDRFIKLDLA